MKKGNISVLFLIVTTMAVILASFFINSQPHTTNSRAAETVNHPPTGKITSIPQSVPFGASIQIEGVIEDPDKNLSSGPLDIFGNRVKLFYSTTASASFPNGWTELTGANSSGPTYQCEIDTHLDRCRISVTFTPTAPGTYQFMINGYDSQGAQCSGNPFYNYETQTAWSKCGEGSYKTVAVVSTNTFASINIHLNTSATVKIHREDGEEKTVTYPASSSKITVSDFVKVGQRYAVRPQTTAPNGYTGGPLTTNDTRSKNQVTGANTPRNSASYEEQLAGTNDCSFEDDTHTLCDFNYLVAPSATPTPTHH